MSFQQHICEKIRSPICVFAVAYTIHMNFIVTEVLIFPSWVLLLSLQIKLVSKCRSLMRFKLLMRNSHFCAVDWKSRFYVLFDSGWVFSTLLSPDNFSDCHIFLINFCTLTHILASKFQGTRLWNLNLKLFCV